MKRALTLIGMLFATCLAGSLTAANANEYPLPPANSRLIGENTTFTVPNDGRPWRPLQPTTRLACWVCWKQTQGLILFAITGVSTDYSEPDVAA